MSAIRHGATLWLALFAWGIAPSMSDPSAQTARAEATGRSLGGPAATEFVGKALDEHGHPVVGAMVVLSGGTFDGATTISTFTGHDGGYRISGVVFKGDVINVKATVRVIGYTQPEQKPMQTDGALGAVRGDLQLRSTTNVADQIPPSAWLGNMPDTQARRVFISVCGNACHGFPNPNVRVFAAALDGTKSDERQQTWMDEALNMKQRFPLIFPDKKLPAVMATDNASSAYDLFGRDDIATFTKTLADYVPTNFEKFDIKDYKPGAKLGVNSKTVIREYAVDEAALLRELDVLPGSPYMWAVDYRRGKLLRLDSRSGEQHWVDIPGDQPGPHTIAPTDDGHFLVALMDYPAIARFDPQTEKFQIFDKVPPHSDVHDIALDYRRVAAVDGQGGIWLTLASQNKLARLDLANGNVETFDAPLVHSRTTGQISMYSVVMTSDKKHLWYTQLFGGIGSFNLETKKFESFLDFPYGDAPHRMAISDRDIVYVPLSGAGEVVAIDAKTAAIVKRYPLPDRNASPYNLSWDNERKVLWVGTSSSNLLYKLDPSSGVFTIYPLPREKTFFRMITVDHDTGDIWASYANYLPKGSAPTYILRISPGDHVAMSK